MIAEAPLDHAIGELDGGVQILRVLELGPIEHEVRPFRRGRQTIARERIDVRGRAERAREVCGAHQSPVNCGLAFARNASYARRKSAVCMQIACACASASIA